jgi:hypothetical protein
MFYDVKILKPQGKTLKVVSGEELSARYWEGLYDAEARKNLNSNGRKQVPGWVKKKLDMGYSHLRAMSISA